MTVRDILTIPDSRLQFFSVPVDRVDDGVRQLVDDMFETMYAASGIGLAAIQVGVSERILVLDVAKRDGRTPICMINPTIVWSSGEKSARLEGCLSIPGYSQTVVRPSRVFVTYQDRHGRPREVHAYGLLSTCIQHEIDHLNGVLLSNHPERVRLK